MRWFLQCGVGMLALLLAAGPVLAKVVTKRVDYTHDGVALQGVLAYDDTAKTMLPGVVVVHEWYGLNEHAINAAKRLAREGYVAFAADIYGKGVLAENNQEASKLAKPFYGDRELLRGRAMAALEQLAAIGKADTEKLFAMGYCFGGTTVLEMARADAPVLGVASFHGGLSTPDPTDMKEFNGQVLAMHGADDPHVSKEEMENFKQELREAGVEWTFVSYGNAVHSFTNPKADSEGARYNERAATLSWRQMLVFFDYLLHR